VVTPRLVGPHYVLAEQPEYQKRGSGMSEPRVELRESHLRSILKGVTWRALATATTVTIAYGVTGTVSVALQIGAIEVVAKIFAYYVHERVWQLVPRGTIRRIYHH
jgi:uncharacterized membrane protein